MSAQADIVAAGPQARFQPPASILYQILCPYRRMEVCSCYAWRGRDTYAGEQEPTTPTAHELTQEEREARCHEQIKRNQALIEMLNEWPEGDEQDQEEQRETWELLKRLLDEDRPSYQKRRYKGTL